MSGLPGDMKEVLSAVVAVAVMMLIILTFTGPVASDFGFSSNLSQNQSTDVLTYGGEGTIPGDVEEVHHVKQSLGQAVELTGADNSEVTAGAGTEYDTNQSVVATWARVDAASNTSNMSVTSAGTDMLIQYRNGTWRGWVYDDTNGSSVAVTATANDPENWTQVMLYRDQGDVRLYTNATLRNSTTLTNTSSTPADSNLSNFDGELEETRAWATALNASQRNKTVDTPLRGITGADTRARFMYDSYSGPSGIEAYFVNSTTNAQNVNLVAGFPAESIAENTDYTLSGDTITLTSAKLQGNPAVFVAATTTGSAGPFADAWAALLNTGPLAMTLVVLAILTLAAMFVMDSIDHGW